MVRGSFNHLFIFIIWLGTDAFLIEPPRFFFCAESILLLLFACLPELFHNPPASRVLMMLSLALHLLMSWFLPKLLALLATFMP